MLPVRTKQRHELKFELPPHDALLLANRLGMLFPRDEHAGPDGRYTVRSLYFDTPFDDALREKHEGFTSRAKWRMRAYGTEPIAMDGAERVIRLEKTFQYLEANKCSITTAAFNNGFNSMPTFYRVLKKNHGVLPAKK